MLFRANPLSEPTIPTVDTVKVDGNVYVRVQHLIDIFYSEQYRYSCVSRFKSDLAALIEHTIRR